MVSFVASVVLLSYCIALTFCDDTLVLQVPRHQPCGNIRNGKEAIRFSDSSTANIMPDPSRGQGCYKLAGNVKVLLPIKGKLNIFVESKNGTHADPVDCKNPGFDGCGGIGSCVYCDACNSLKKDSRNKVQLMSNGQSLDCNKGLQVGEYPNVVLSFCTPDLDDFLRSQNIARSAWDDVIGPHGTSVFETVHIFQDTPINTYSKEQRKEAVRGQTGLVGCHKLVLNLSSRKSDGSK